MAHTHASTRDDNLTAGCIRANDPRLRAHIDVFRLVAALVAVFTFDAYYTSAKAQTVFVEAAEVVYLGACI